MVEWSSRPQHPGGACGAVRNLKRVCRQPASQPARAAEPPRREPTVARAAAARARAAWEQREGKGESERKSRKRKQKNVVPLPKIWPHQRSRRPDSWNYQGEGGGERTLLLVMYSYPLLTCPRRTSPHLTLPEHIWSAMAVHSYPRYLSHVAPYTSYLCTRGRGEGRGGSGKEGPQVS